MRLNRNAVLLAIVDASALGSSTPALGSISSHSRGDQTVSKFKGEKARVTGISDGTPIRIRSIEEASA